MSKIRPRFVVWLSFKGRMKVIIAALLTLVVAVLISINVPASETWSTWNMPLSGMTIAVDAGHGGVDGGAVSKDGAIEKDLNLSIALYLRDYLQEAGAIVVMTREGDYDLANLDTKGYAKRKTEDLLRRVSNLQDAKPEIVLSIHMNSIPSERWSGAQTFYDVRATETSEKLAVAIQKQLQDNLQNTNRNATTVDTIYLIKAMSSVPTALVEVGFLSNPKESKLLVDAEYQRQVAASIYKGILAYVSEADDE